MPHRASFSRRLPKFLLPGLAAALAFGNDPLAAAPAGYELRGQLTHAAPGTRVLLLDPDAESGARLDSAVTDAAGRFVLRGRVPEPAVYHLRLPGQPDPLPVALDNAARVQLTADARQLLTSARLTGNGATPVLQRLQDVLLLHRQRTRDLIQQGEQRPEPWTAAWNARTAGTMRFIRQHAGSYVAGYATLDLSGYSRDEAFLDSVTNHLAAHQPAARYTRLLLERQRVRRVTAAGQPAPELVLPGADGKTVALSSLRGRYVLIDFWASWCKPCRAENPAMVQLYRQYQPKGFEVYAVSLDDSREKWLKAVAADGLPWIQVSDLQGFRSPSADTYDARAIPLTVLVDPQGRIVAKNLRGAALEARLAALLP